MNLLLPVIIVLLALVAAMVSYLIYRIFTVQSPPATPLTPLAQAVFDDDVERVEALLNLGADPNTTLNTAYRIEHGGGITSTLYTPVVGGARPEPGMPVLSYAAMQGSTEIVRLLLSKGADSNTIDAYGQTPLILAAWIGDTESANLLLNRNADAALKDKTERTALDWAQLEGRTEVVELLTSR